MIERVRAVSRKVEGVEDGTEVEITFAELVRQIDVRWDTHTRIVVQLAVGGREHPLPLVVLAPGEGLRIKSIPPPGLHPPVRVEVDSVVEVLDEDDGEAT